MKVIINYLKNLKMIVFNDILFIVNIELIFI